MKFTERMKLETEKPLNNLNQNGTNFTRNTNKNSNKKNIIKIIFMLLLSNIFFYLLFSPSEKSSEIVIAKTAVTKGHTRVNILLKNAIATIDNKIPISIYEGNRLLIKKAYLINDGIDQNLTDDNFEDDQLTEDIRAGIATKLFTVEINKFDLPKIITNRRKSNLWAYPYSENINNKQRKKYEIIF